MKKNIRLFLVVFYFIESINVDKHKMHHSSGMEACFLFQVIYTLTQFLNTWREISWNCVFIIQITKAVEHLFLLYILANEIKRSLMYNYVKVSCVLTRVLLFCVFYSVPTFSFLNLSDHTAKLLLSSFVCASFTHSRNKTSTFYNLKTCHETALTKPKYPAYQIPVESSRCAGASRESRLTNWHRDARGGRSGMRAGCAWVDARSHSKPIRLV